MLLEDVSVMDVWLFCILLVLMFLAVSFLNYGVAPRDKDLDLGSGGLCPSGRGHNTLPNAQEIHILLRYE
jgi:hypothetical protein